MGSESKLFVSKLSIFGISSRVTAFIFASINFKFPVSDTLKFKTIVSLTSFDTIIISFCKKSEICEVRIFWKHSFTSFLTVKESHAEKLGYSSTSFQLKVCNSSFKIASDDVFFTLKLLARGKHQNK